MSRQIEFATNNKPVVAMNGNSGGAMRRFKKRLASEGWETSEDFKLKEGYLYTVVRAISARVNQNYDGWPSHELKAAYKTFLGKPCFVNHENYDPKMARGVIVAARYKENGNDKYIEVIQEIDAKRFPKLAKEIRTGGLDSVSMGAEAGFTICSYCDNKATDLHDMCDHVMYHKGQTLQRHSKKTGNVEDVLVYESCHKLSFFELSYVFDPADETAVASKVVMAGKYTKDDFKIQDGKKPWERDKPAAPEEPETPKIPALEALKRIAHNRAMKLAWGETEAPTAVNTLREEGSAPEDENNDFERYVDPPKELGAPDLSEAAQIDREQQEDAGQAGQGAAPAQQPGVPGAPMAPAQPQQQMMTLQIPVPQSAPQVPMQTFAKTVTAETLDYFDRYFGRRIANWQDAITEHRELTAAESIDYQRQAVNLSTLEKDREVFTTVRNTTKGTAKMTLADRSKVVTAGRRQHYADGPLVDSGDQSRNDQGEKEDTFITQTPAEEAVVAPTDDTDNISNTEGNLVARIQRGRTQLIRDAQQLASLRGRKTAGDAGGPVATEVNPSVNTGPAAEELTGDHFESANPNDGVTETQPKDASLKKFQAFDSWLAKKTGKNSKAFTETGLKRAVAAYTKEARVSSQSLFPALGIVLREARKSEKAITRGAKMQKRADEKLEVAAPDGRVDVEAPTSGTTDAEAQASQFDIHDFGNNASDNVADPDLSTDQNWAPGEANGSKKSSAIKIAGGILAMRCAEGMIAAGLEPNTRERKYQLAAQMETMSRGVILDRVALLERFASIREADRRKVASGNPRGAVSSPIPAGFSGGGTRTAATQVLAANDPMNDSLLFG